MQPCRNLSGTQAALTCRGEDKVCGARYCTQLVLPASFSMLMGSCAGKL